MKSTGKQSLKVLCIVLYSFSLGWSSCKHLQQDYPRLFSGASLVVALVGLVAFVVSAFIGPICQRKNEGDLGRTNPCANGARQE